MIEIRYTLHTDDGGIEYAEITAPLVPRVGELVAISQGRSYQVVDVVTRG
ncbi:hypothetical protein [Amycolatopsis rubida]|uniref:Uncharacterized protein n=1 Tax=Amycolatopsis rubida TaxID=112413 RepID=A0A1I5X5F5_9PSEU|nr:hypothetical protein [Amycolatopsis rubida]SFQ27056.1 hypothetical protein SAMN05421854_11036 [Amycolatopsis rubida]